MQEKTFDAQRTRNFFEGLLLQGFCQTESVAEQIMKKGGIWKECRTAK